MKNFWVSWWQNRELGPFELHSPWWVSGSRGLGPSTFDESIVAAVKAEDEAAARQVVVDSYDKSPDEIEFRFVEERPNDWEPFSDRFPRAEWMKWEKTEVCDHFVRHVMYSDYGPGPSATHSLFEDAFEHQVCALCGHVVSSVCTHPWNEWNDDGTVLSCVVCKADGT